MWKWFKNGLLKNHPWRCNRICHETSYWHEDIQARTNRGHSLKGIEAGKKLHSNCLNANGVVWCITQYCAVQIQACTNKPVVYTVNTCLMWLYFNVLFNGHIRQDWMYDN